MANNIKLSKKYGLNPSIETCMICGKDMGIVLFGDSYKENGKKAKAPMNICSGKICEDCIEKFKKENKVCIIEVVSMTDESRTGRYGLLDSCAIDPEFLKNGDRVFICPSDEFSMIFKRLSN